MLNAYGYIFNQNIVKSQVFFTSSLLSLIRWLSIVKCDSFLAQAESHLAVGNRFSLSSINFSVLYNALVLNMPQIMADCLHNIYLRARGVAGARLYLQVKVFTYPV